MWDSFDSDDTQQTITYKESNIGKTINAAFIQVKVRKYEHILVIEVKDLPAIDDDVSKHHHKLKRRTKVALFGINKDGMKQV